MLHELVRRHLNQQTVLDMLPSLMRVAEERSRMRIFEPGETVLKQGEPILQLMIPISAPLLLSRQDQAGKPEPVGYLYKGRSLCMREILLNEPAPYSAFVEEPANVLCIPVADVRTCLEANEVIRDYLLTMVSSAGARNLKRLLAEHAILDTGIQALLARTEREPLILEAGATLEFTEPTIYFIDEGVVSISSAGSEDWGRAELGEGAWFGGEGTVPPHDYTYRCKIVARTKLHVLRYAEVAPIIDEYGIAEYLVGDPWIYGRGQRSSGYQQFVTPLPGDLIGPEQLLSLGIPFDPTRLALCKSDSESAAASMMNLAMLSGFEVNPRNIEVELGTAAKRTLLTIANILEPYGLVATPIRTTFETLSRQILPNLVGYGPRLMVLFKVTKRAVLLIDPCRGIVAMSRDDFKQKWDGIVLEVTRAVTDQLAAAESTDRDMNAAPKSTANANTLFTLALPIWKILYRYPSLIFNRFGLGLVSLALGALMPKLSQYMIDDVLGLRERDTLVVCMAGMVLITLFQIAHVLCTALVQAVIASRFDITLTELFYRHALNTPQASRGSQNVGEIQARMGSLQSVKDFVANTPDAIVMNLIHIVFYAAILVGYDPMMALICFALLPATFLIRFVYRRLMYKSYLRSFDLNKDTYSLLTEQVSAMATIKATGAEDRMRHRYEEVNAEGVTLRRRIGNAGHVVEIVVDMLTRCVQYGALWLGCQQVAAGKMSLGSVLAVNLYISSLIGPLMQLGTMLTSMEQLRIEGEKLLGFFRVPRDEPASDALSKHAVALKGKIKLERVGFRYNDKSQWVLKDINLTIFPRQVVAIVGQSGCGKTTLANMISGILKPSTGRISFDNFDAEMLTLSSRQNQIGVIMQDSDLFAGSISENIAYADDAPSDIEVQVAAAKACVTEFVDRLPQGYSTYLAEGGLGLSGGQKQRVSIARALYRNPRILIMDEATSALDAESEAGIITKMHEILRGRTAVVIAHRLSTIRSADRILVMKDGEIVEDGNHAALLSKRGYYYDLFSSQLAAEA